MNEDDKEFLGVGKHDFWYYPGLVAALVSFRVVSPSVVVALLVLSTTLLVIFLAKSTPRYLKSPELRKGTRRFGLAGNVALVILQVGIVAVRVARM